VLLRLAQSPPSLPHFVMQGLLPPVMVLGCGFSLAHVRLRLGGVVCVPPLSPPNKTAQEQPPAANRRRHSESIRIIVMSTMTIVVIVII